jgi:hypothetical protein
MDTTDLIFGLIGDTQYVNSDDGTTFDGKVVRRYRQSLSTLEEACKSFEEHKAISCILLGDVLDAKCKSLGSADECLKKILTVTGKRSHYQTWHYSIGNHDLVCLNRQDILQNFIPENSRHSCSPSKLYYDTCPKDGYRFIFLDGYDVSTLNASSDENKLAAEKLLASKNPNLVIENAGWFNGLSKMDQRFVPFNGGIGMCIFIHIYMYINI